MLYRRPSFVALCVSPRCREERNASDQRERPLNAARFIGRGKLQRNDTAEFHVTLDSRGLGGIRNQGLIYAHFSDTRLGHAETFAAFSGRYE